MRPQTLATLKQLEEQSWFSAVGVSDSRAVNFLTTWPQAIASCSSLEWENLCLEAVDQYRARILERNPERLAKWNQIANEIKQISVPLVKQKISRVVAANALPKTFEDTVQWDALHLCLEAEFSDIYSPGFYASQAYWYMKGHFPCGWQGAFPDGKLVVF